MNGCATCGGFGMHHDPVAHGLEPRQHDWQPWEYDSRRDQWWRACADCEAREGRAGMLGQPNGEWEW